jgi:hypothetical protein
MSANLVKLLDYIIHNSVGSIIYLLGNKRMRLVLFLVVFLLLIKEELVPDILSPQFMFELLTH